MSSGKDKTLWRAVILQALDDASRPLSKVRHRRLDQVRWPFLRGGGGGEQGCEEKEKFCEVTHKDLLCERRFLARTVPRPSRHQRELQQQRALEHRKIVVGDHGEHGVAFSRHMGVDAFHVVDLLPEISLEDRRAVNHCAGRE